MGGRVEGKVAVITGGASGVGFETVRQFVAEGARGALGDIDEAALAAAAAELAEACLPVPMNVTDEEDVSRFVAAAVHRFGRLDIGVNSAGLSTFGAITDHAEGDWDLTVDVCLKGVFLAMKHEARHLVAQASGGAIVNVASLNAVQAGEGMAPYCAAKAGVAMLTKVGALELGRHGIRVNAIAPGLIDTPLTQFQRDLPSIRSAYLENTPLGRVGTTADVAAVALFLASDEASWLTGDLVLVDGGAHTRRYPEMLRLTAEAMEALLQTEPPPA